MSTAANSRAEGNHRDTSDPSVPSEPTGPIASDSLAADSLEAGGDFAANNPGATALGVEGHKSTLATTDASAAVPLPPASSGAARDKAELRGLGDDERGVSGVKYPDAAGQPKHTGTTTSEGNYYGGPSSDRQGAGYTTQPAGASDFGASTTTTTAAAAAQSGSSGVISSSSSGGGGGGGISSSATSSGPSPGTGIRPHVDAAPNYAARVSGAISSEGEFQPKGSGLIDGGDVPENIKTFTGNVGGGQNDPGRLAQAKFEGINAQVAGGSGAGVGGGGGDKEGTTEQGGQYGVLESERL